MPNLYQGIHEVNFGKLGETMIFYEQTELLYKIAGEKIPVGSARLVGYNLQLFQSSDLSGDFFSVPVHNTDSVMFSIDLSQLLLQLCGQVIENSEVVTVHMKDKVVSLTTDARLDQYGLYSLTNRKPVYLSNEENLLKCDHLINTALGRLTGVILQVYHTKDDLTQIILQSEQGHIGLPLNWNGQDKLRINSIISNYLTRLQEGEMDILLDQMIEGSKNLEEIYDIQFVQKPTQPIRRPNDTDDR